MAARMIGLALLLITLIVLSAYTPGLGPPRTPLQVVASSSTHESTLQTARFSIEQDITQDVPANVSQALGGHTVSGVSLLSGSGELVFPSSGHMLGQLTYQGQVGQEESINVNNRIYVRDSQRWQVSTVGAVGWGQVGSPLLVPMLLDAASSVQDLGNTRIDNVGVHHYAVFMDRAKLAPVLAGSLRDSPPGSVLRQMVESADFTVEVWIDRGDLYVRRVLLNIDSAIDAIALMASMQPSRSLPAVTPGLSLSSGVTFTIRVHEVVTYRDFNAHLVIKAPSVSALP